MITRLDIIRTFGTLLLGVMLLGSSSLLWQGRALAAPKPEKVSAAQAAAVVNINKAGAEELQSLRGVGPALAERIIQYRTEHGRFERVEDLSQVRGIGEAKFQKLKDHVSL